MAEFSLTNKDEVKVYCSIKGKKAEYIITGNSVEAINAEVASICERFHPLAYETRFGNVTFDQENGNYYVIGSRYTSAS